LRHDFFPSNGVLYLPFLTLIRYDILVPLETARVLEVA
jgi:hypothetical protein